jgi:putative tryptophan/tyrosine transport system substrate-binding protein
LPPMIDPPHHPGMDRRRFLLTTLAGALAAPVAAGAQQAKVWRIGLLGPTGDQNENRLFGVFREEKARLGYVEGKNVVFVHRSSYGQDTALPGLARELVTLNPDVLVTSAGATGAAKDASQHDDTDCHGHES